MLILVTGLRGFTGRYVQSELENNGHEVVGLSCNLTDQKAVVDEILRVQPEAVIHLAGVAFVGHKDSRAFYHVNLIGTYNLLAALAQNASNVRSVLLVSSSQVYGNQSEGVLDENTIPNPTNDYAVSKLAMENMAWLWRGKLPLFIVRPFNYTGVGQARKFVIPKIVSHFRELKKTIELGNIDIARDFSDVRDVAQAYRKLIEACPVGETINICSARSNTLSQIIDLCEEITGHKIEIKVNPEFVRANEVRVLMGDNSRLKQLIDGWQPYSLKETLQWMLQNNSLG